VADKRECLERLLKPIPEFIRCCLALELHPKKITIRSLHQGVDFLGYVIFPHHRSIRTKTARRIVKKIQRRVREYRTDKIGQLTLKQSLQSYLGVLSHANAHKLSEKIKNQIWFES
jgi:hypothetical protein